MGKVRAPKKASTKRKASSAKEGGDPTPPSRLADLQAELAEVDRGLLKTLNQRARLAQKIVKTRRAGKQPDIGWGREDEAISKVVRANRGPLPAACIRAVFREIVCGCRSMVTTTRVAFLGPLYSYSHLAAIRHFGQSVELTPVGSIAAVFEEVNRGQSDFGLVPIENSTDGRIADTLDMFARLPVRICGEVELEIHHALLGKCSRADVQEVYSKPQALSQCRNWLAKHLPSARSIEVTSTSAAAQLALEKPGVAAVASLEAGMHFGLDVLAERIEDNPSNTTRFAVIGEHSSQPTGNDRTAMLFQVEHRPGALADAMNIFKQNGLNLTWIESFPVPDTKRAYLFFVEMEGHETDAPVKRAFSALEDGTLRLEILGSFPVESAEP